MNVLLVEDEFLVRMMIADMLESLGCTLVGTASTVEEAITLCALTSIQLGLLDVNVNDREVYPVARILRSRNIPIVFSTGYARAGLPDEWTSYSVLQKPFDGKQLSQAIEKFR